MMLNFNDFIKENYDRKDNIKDLDINIIVHEDENYSLANLYDTATSYWEDTLEYIDIQKEKISKDIPINTMQYHYSSQFIDKLDDDIYKKSDIILYKDDEDQLWLLDGHHRLIYDRLNNRNSVCYIITPENKDEIEYLFYNIEE